MRASFATRRCSGGSRRRGVVRAARRQHSEREKAYAMRDASLPSRRYARLPPCRYADAMMLPRLRGFTCRHEFTDIITLLIMLIAFTLLIDDYAQPSRHIVFAIHYERAMRCCCCALWRQR